MKSKKELNALKEEVETVNKKLAELSEEELEQVTGGEIHISYVIDDDPVEDLGSTSTDRLATGVKIDSGLRDHNSLSVFNGKILSD